MKKVIHIQTHSLLPEKLNPQASVFTQFHIGWHARVAQQVRKYSPDYVVECWRVQETLRVPFEEEREGLRHRLFPATSFSLLGEWSPSLLRALRQETAQGEVLVHLHDVYNLVTYSVARSFRHIPLVASDYIDAPFLLRARRTRREGRHLAWLGNLALYLGFHFPLERLALKHIGHCFVLTDSCREYLAQRLGPERVEVLAPGVDFDFFRPMDKGEARRALGLEVDRRYILTVALLSRGKGVDYLLRAFPRVLERYPQSVLLFIGDGPLRSELETLSRGLRLGEKVHFLGWRDNSTLPLWYNAADVAILPAWNQSYTLAGVEALACGTPFIGTRVGNVPSIVETFKAGRVIPPRDEEAIGRSLIECLSSPDSFHPDRDSGAQRYDRRAVAQRLLEVYRDLFARYYPRKRRVTLGR